MTEKPLLTIKPSVINAIVPNLAKNLVYSFIACFILFWITVGLRTLKLFSISTNLLIIIYVSILFVIAIIPLVIKIFVLMNTKYEFYKNYVVSEMEFFVIKRSSIPYEQIVNISADSSVWDRLCNASDITLQTANETDSLVLMYVTEPDKIEHNIHAMIRKSTSK